MENKELINKFREFVLSLSDQSKDFKDQALEILDNPEGEDGDLSIAQVDKLHTLIKLNEEALMILGNGLAEEKAVIEEFLGDLDSQQERLNNTFEEVQKDFEEDIDLLKASSSEE